MKSVTFKGKDKFDLDQQVAAWRSANPKFVVKIIHPDVNLPVDVTKPKGRFANKNPPPDKVSRRIDYED